MNESVESDALGPVELGVLEFPGASFDGSIAAALADLVDRGIVSILDLVMVHKDEDGVSEVIELADVEKSVSDRFDRVDGQVMWLLSDEDIASVSEALEPGTTGVLIVWEDRWARDLSRAVGESEGRVVLHERLDSREVAASIAESGT